MAEFIYRVRKKFKYNNKLYKPGDEFIPAGGKFDDKLIDPDNGLVSIEEQRNSPKRSRAKAGTK